MVVLWNIERSEEPFVLVNVTPEKLQELSEVITCAQFHPQHSWMFLWGSTKGAVYLCDMRDSLENKKKITLKSEQDSNSFLSEITNSISDAKFANSEGTQIIAREFTTLKLWDTRNTRNPISTVNVLPNISSSKLVELYECDAVFDKFGCCANNIGSCVVTGGYARNFTVYQTTRESALTLTVRSKKGHTDALERQPLRRPKQSVQRTPKKVLISKKGKEIIQSDPDYSEDNKILQSQWHPSLNIIALTVGNTLYIYYADEL